MSKLRKRLYLPLTLVLTIVPIILQLVAMPRAPGKLAVEVEFDQLLIAQPDGLQDKIGLTWKESVTNFQHLERSIEQVRAVRLRFSNSGSEPFEWQRRELSETKIQIISEDAIILSAEFAIRSAASRSVPIRLVESADMRSVEVSTNILNADENFSVTVFHTGVKGDLRIDGRFVDQSKIQLVYPEENRAWVNVYAYLRVLLPLGSWLLAGIAYIALSRIYVRSNWWKRLGNSVVGASAVYMVYLPFWLSTMIGNDDIFLDMSLLAIGTAFVFPSFYLGARWCLPKCVRVQLFMKLENIAYSALGAGESE